MGHALCKVDASDPLELKNNEEEIDPSVLNLISSWIVERTGGAKE
jgi:hypothetical protein